MRPSSVLCPSFARSHALIRKNPMSLKCGIVGLPNVGKSTLFNALTKAGIAAENYPFCTIEPNVGVVELPDARLKKLCEAMLNQPGRHASLEAWSTEAALSARTVSRLFRDELGTSFAQWRSQVLLAHALSMAARRKPMSHIAAELGYASASAFTAMVTRTVGMPPSRFFAEA